MDDNRSARGNGLLRDISVCFKNRRTKQDVYGIDEEVAQRLVRKLGKYADVRTGTYFRKGGGFFVGNEAELIRSRLVGAKMRNEFDYELTVFYRAPTHYETDSDRFSNFSFFRLEVEKISRNGILDTFVTVIVERHFQNGFQFFSKDFGRKNVSEFSAEKRSFEFRKDLRHVASFRHLFDGYGSMVIDDGGYSHPLGRLHDGPRYNPGTVKNDEVRRIFAKEFPKKFYEVEEIQFDFVERLVRVESFNEF